MILIINLNIIKEYREIICRWVCFSLNIWKFISDCDLFS